MDVYMQEMYRKQQPLSEILKADFFEMKMCFGWSQKIADVEEKTGEKIKNELGSKCLI